jgi:ribosomal-protein-alanine N-acetyltransferase
MRVGMETYLSLLEEGDLRQAVEIERDAFPTLWPPTSFKQGLNNSRYTYLVAWLPRELVLSQQLASQAADTSSRGSLFDELVRGVKRLASPHPPPDNGRYSLGFVGLWFGVDEAHITAIAVRQQWRGQGIGDLLMIGAFKLAEMHRCKLISLEVRTSNRVAQSLYEKYGFKKVGLRKAYYLDNREDAVVMSTDPFDTPGYSEMLESLRNEYIQKRGDYHLTFA